jgi:hypothetical protein
MAKYDIKKTKVLKFARFGGLSSVVQLGYKAKPKTFHSPPATRGFYCFVWPYYEAFLIGGSWTAWPWKLNSKFSYIRDAKGEIITDKHPEFETYISPNKVFQVPTKNWNKNADARPDLWDRTDDTGRKYTDSEMDEIDARMDKDWEDNHKDEPKWVYAIRPSPKIFTYDGNLWHHLGTHLKPNQILKTKGGWTLSSMEDYRIALEKEMHH